MTNKQLTKRALLSSVIAMLICTAMLIGTTFAWFTDTASTAVNKIQAGSLDVGLVDASGANLEGVVLNFKKAEGHEAEQILWEPGCTYSLPDVFVKNNGNLALKYKVAITGINGNAKLNEAIEWTINGIPLDTWQALDAGAKSAALKITGHMKEDAGNEYQGLYIDGIGITVYATQNTAESDSFNNQYDANAPYVLPDGVKAVDFGSNVAYYNGAYYADLQAAINAVGTDGTIYIKPEQKFEGTSTTAAVFTIAGNKNITLELNDSTFEYKMQYPASGANNMTIFKINGGSLTVNGNGKMVVSNTADTRGGNYATTIFSLGNTQNSSLTINGGSYFANFTEGSDFTVLGIVDATAYSCVTNVTINDGYFYSDDTIVRNYYNKGPGALIDMDVVINGGTFVAGDAAGYGYRGWIWNHGSSTSVDANCKADIIINGGKFVDIKLMNYQMSSAATYLGVTVNNIDGGSLYFKNNKAVISNPDYWTNCTYAINTSKLQDTTASDGIGLIITKK